MASVRRKDRSPFWFACFTSADGSRTQVSTKQRDRRKAQATADQFEKAARLGVEKRLAETQARKVLSSIYEITNGEPLATASTREFLTQWPETRKESISNRTYLAYKQAARDFNATLGTKADRDISQITRNDVAKYRDKVASITTAANANKLLKYLRVGFGAAWKDGLIQDNPAAKVDRLPRNPANEISRRPFTMPEIRTILAQATGELRGLLLFGFYTGQRLADVGSLCWNNVNLEDGIIRFSTGKTGRRMELPIAGPLLEYIETMDSSDDPQAPLFPKSYPIATSETGDSRLSQQFYDLLVLAGLATKRTKEETGLGRSRRRKVSEISYHSLRHTATSLLKNAGVSESVAMDIIGHDSAAISRHYTHIEEKTKRKALAKLPDITTGSGS
jgi:integrase